MIKKTLQKYSQGTFFLNTALITEIIIALVTIPIILRSLPSEHYGKWQFVLALQTWLLVFTAKEITSASKRGIARGLSGTFVYAFLARLKLLIPLGILILGAILYLKVTGDNILSMLLLIVGVFIIFGYLFQLSLLEFLIAQKRYKIFCFWQILITAVSLIGSTIVALITKNIINFASFQLGSTTVLSWIGWFWIVRKNNLIENYKKGNIDKDCVPYGFKMLPVNLVAVTSTRISHFIIGPFLGFTNLAVFSVANAFRDKAAASLKTFYSLFYVDFAQTKRKKLTRIINRYLMKLAGIGILSTLIFIGTSWLYIKFLLPAKFAPAIIYFLILALGLPAVILAVVLYTLLAAHLRYKELAMAGIGPNLLKILLIFVFGYFWKIKGVCLALALSAWITFGFYYLLTVKKEPTLKLVKKALSKIQ